jgi:hydrogenase-4 component E
MTSLLVALLGILVLPLFTATWRMSLAMLGAQGLMMAWLFLRHAPIAFDVADCVTLIDFVLLRGLLAPVLLYRVLRARNAPRRHDIIPPNLLFWTLAVTAVLLAFECAKDLIVLPGDQRLLAAVSATGVLLGLLVLASQSNPFGQIIGVLRIENAIALFELGLRERPPLPLQLGQLALFAATIFLYSWYLAVLPAQDSTKPESVPEGPAL